MNLKTIVLLREVRIKIEQEYIESDLVFALSVLDRLIAGEMDIAIHPNPIKIIDCDYEYVSVRKLLEEKEYPYQRKICYELGKMIPCHTTKIKGRCGILIGCRDKRWGGDGSCGCEDLVPNNFWSYHYDNNYDDFEAFSILPWTCTIGVRFCFSDETQNHTLSKYFKMLGPFPY